MEAYVDDMVVKSRREEAHVEDLKELFNALDKYKLKLNPEKYVFRVKAGKFLGFMLTQRGIEMNLDKYMAIMNMRNPSSVKEVQQLTGRITSLSQFIPKEGDKAYPYLQCLKGNNHFQWTNECEKTF